MRADSAMRERRRPDALCGSCSRPARRAERNSLLPCRAAACAARARRRERAPGREAGPAPRADRRRAGARRHLPAGHRVGVAVGRRAGLGRGAGLGLAGRGEREDRGGRQRRRRGRARPCRQVSAHLERALRGWTRVRDRLGHGTFVASLATGSVTNGTGISGFGGDAQLLVVQAIDADGYITGRGRGCRGRLRGEARREDHRTVRSAAPRPHRSSGARSTGPPGTAS